MDRTTYHSDPCETPSLNASTAKILISGAPIHAWMQHPKLNPAFVRDDDTKYDIGNAAHHLLLEGGPKLVIISAPDYKTKAAREERAAALAADQVPIIEKHHDTVQRMVDAARKAWAACPDLAGYNDPANGEAEHTLIWNAGQTTVRGVFPESTGPMRGRLDWLSKDRQLVIDYKTTKGSANPSTWLRGAMDNGVDLQAAFYLWGNLAVHGADEAKFVFLVQETDEPYCCSFVGVSPMLRDLGDWKVLKAVSIWQKCLDANNWPGYSNRINWPDPPPWEMAGMEAE